MEILILFVLILFILAATSKDRPSKGYTVCETSSEDPVENGDVKLNA